MYVFYDGLSRLGAHGEWWGKVIPHRNEDDGEGRRGGPGRENLRPNMYTQLSNRELAELGLPKFHHPLFVLLS